MAQRNEFPMLMERTVIPVPRSMVGRLSPISPIAFPQFASVEPKPMPKFAFSLLPQHLMVSSSRMAQNVYPSPPNMRLAV